MAEIERVRAVIAQMRLEEKVSLTDIVGGTLTRACPPLMVPSLRLPEDCKPFARCATPFAALGASFDRALAAELGRAVSVRAALDGCAFAGTVPVAITRSPMEDEDVLGEDPVAVSALVAAYCREAVVPYLADRLFARGLDRWFDVRALHELYLKPYNDNRALLGGIIAPGGAVNGSLCSAKPFAAVYDKTKPVLVRGHELADPVEAVGGGAFLTLDGAGTDASAVYTAIKNGKLFEKKLDHVLEPLLCRCVDHNEFRKNTLPTLSAPDLEPLTRRLAERSTVLLKNEATLPFEDFRVVSDRTIFVGLNGKPTPRMIKKAVKYTAGHNALLILHIDGPVEEGQKKLAEAVIAAARSTAVVLSCRRAVETGFLERAGAILYAPLFDYGTVERIVRGELSPSGRLPFTWAETADDYPSAQKRGNRESYAFESVYVGYRYFDAFSVGPAYPFGHGLGYLDVSVALGKATLKEDGLHLKVTCVNRADRAGEHVLIAYARLSTDNVFGVNRRLAAFTRVTFEGAGEVQTELVVDTRDLCVYDPSSGEWVLPGGKYVFEVGDAQTDEIKLGKKYKMKGYTSSDVPSYYPGPVFRPLGVETERLLGAKAFAGQSEIHRYLCRADGHVHLLYNRIYKKYRIPRVERPQVERQLEGLSLFSLEKAAHAQ